MDLSLTAVELGKKIKNKEISVVEATTAFLDSMEAKEKDINLVVTPQAKEAFSRKPYYMYTSSNVKKATKNRKNGVFQTKGRKFQNFAKKRWAK